MTTADTAPTPTPTGRPSEAADAGRRPSLWWAVAGLIAISSWPFLALAVANPDQSLDLGVMLRWWAITLAIGLVVTLAAWAAAPEIGRWVATTWIVLVWLFFSFRPLSRVVRDVGWAGHDRVGWGLLAAVVLVAILPLSRLTVVQRFVGIGAFALALGMLAQLAFVTVSGPAQATTDGAPTDATFRERPSVWFFALDAAASNDFMRDRTGYDPVAFERELTDRGFAIQQAATSNYPFTAISLAATLDMTYVYEGVEEPRSRALYDKMGGDNAVVELFRANGYSYAHNYPGFYGGSRCVGAEDVCLGTAGSLTETELALSEMVPFGEWFTNRSKHEDIAVANDPAHVARQIVDARLPDPLYAFVHVLNPHAPLLRGADCEVREQIPLSFSDWGDGPEYADAVRCLHRQLTEAVEVVLDEDPDALIIIQGDHGPRFGVDWEDHPEGILFDQDMHFSILSAIRLPAACQDLEVPDDLTPVNTFRLVRACLEGTEPELLPNRRFPIRAVRGH